MNPVDPKLSAKESVAASKAAVPVRLSRVLVVAIVIILIGLAAGLIPRWFSRRALGQEMAERPVMGSLTPTEVRVTLPVFVTL